MITQLSKFRVLTVELLSLMQVTYAPIWFTRKDNSQ